MKFFINLRRMAVLLSLVLAITPVMNVAASVALSAQQAASIFEDLTQSKDVDLLLTAAGLQTSTLFTALEYAFNSAVTSYKSSSSIPASKIQALFSNYQADYQNLQPVIAVYKNPVGEIIAGTNVNAVNGAMQDLMTFMGGLFPHLQDGYMDTAISGMVLPFTGAPLGMTNVPKDQTPDQYYANIFVNELAAWVPIQAAEVAGRNNVSTIKSLCIAAQQIGNITTCDGSMTNLISLAVDSNNVPCSNSSTVQAQINCAVNWYNQKTVSINPSKGGTGITGGSSAGTGSSSGLSAGAIAGIVIGLIIFLAGVSLFVSWRAGFFPKSAAAKQTLEERVQQIGEEIAPGGVVSDTDLLAKLTDAEFALQDPTISLQDLEDVFGTIVNELHVNTAYTEIFDSLTQAAEDVAATDELEGLEIDTTDSDGPGRVETFEKLASEMPLGDPGDQIEAAGKALNDAGITDANTGAALDLLADRATNFPASTSMSDALAELGKAIAANPSLDLTNSTAVRAAVAAENVPDIPTGGGDIPTSGGTGAGSVVQPAEQGDDFATLQDKAEAGMSQISTINDTDFTNLGEILANQLVVAAGNQADLATAQENIAKYNQEVALRNADAKAAGEEEPPFDPIADGL